MALTQPQTNLLHPFPNDIETLELMRYQTENPGLNGRLIYKRVEARYGPGQRELPRPAQGLPTPGSAKLSINDTESGVVVVRIAGLQEAGASTAAFPPLAIRIGSMTRLHEEKAFYDTLWSLQGTFIPRCYGLFETADGRTVLLIERVMGKLLTRKSILQAEEETREKVMELYRALARFGFRCAEHISRTHIVTSGRGDDGPYCLGVVGGLVWESWGRGEERHVKTARTAWERKVEEMREEEENDAHEREYDSKRRARKGQV